MTADHYAAYGVANPHQPLTAVERAAGVQDPTAYRYLPAGGDIVEVTRTPWKDDDEHPWNGTRRARVKVVGQSAVNLYLVPVEPITTPAPDGFDPDMWAAVAAGMWWDTASVKPIRTSDPDAPANQASFAWTWEDTEISTGTAEQFADVLAYAEYSPAVQALYAAVDGMLQPVTWTTSYDDNDFARVTVVITFPDGRETATGYRVDGRS
jgi:hypothetical protein